MDRYVWAALVLLAAGPAAPAIADRAAAEDDIMMSVVGSEDADEQAFVEEIELPLQSPARNERDADADDESGNAPSSQAATQGSPGSAARDRARGPRDSGRPARDLPPGHGGRPPMGHGNGNGSGNGNPNPGNGPGGGSGSGSGSGNGNGNGNGNPNPGNGNPNQGNGGN